MNGGVVHSADPMMTRTFDPAGSAFLAAVTQKMRSATAMSLGDR